MVYLLWFLVGVYVLAGVLSEKVRQKTPWMWITIAYFASLMLVGYWL